MPSEAEPEEEPVPKPTWEQRLERAENLARRDKEILDDQTDEEDLPLVPPLPGIPPENRYYVLLRGKPPCACEGFTTRVAVLNDHLENKTKFFRPPFRKEVYSKFASKREARAYWAAIFVTNCTSNFAAQ